MISIASKIREASELLAFMDVIKNNIIPQIEKQWNASKTKPDPVRHFIDSAQTAVKRWMEMYKGFTTKIIKAIEKVTGNKVTWEKNELVPV